MQNKQMNKNSIATSFFWKLFERIGTQGILFVISIIVARILSPQEYGILAIQMVFINLANSLVQNGLNVALVQKKDIKETDYSTALVLSLAVSLLFYIIIHFCAPYIARFYEMPILTSTLRVLSITLFSSAVLVVQNAYLMRNMLFKQLAICSFISSILSGVVGVFCAYRGLGVWSLVFQQLSSNILLPICVIIATKWFPSFGFSKMSAKKILSFGIPIASSHLLDTLYSDLRSLIIGKLYSSSQLGVFERAKQFPRIITSNISNTIQSIILPVFSKNKENLVLIREKMAKAIEMIYIFVMPAMLFMCVSAKPLVVTLLTEKWIECVPLLIAASLMCLFWPLHAINIQTFVAMGYSKLRLTTELIVKVVDFSALFISLFFFDTVLAIAIGATIASILSAVIYSYPCDKYLSFGFLKQLFIILPYTLYSVVSVGVMYIIGVVLSSKPDFLILIIELIVGGLIYLLLLYCFSKRSLMDLLKILYR